MRRVLAAGALLVAVLVAACNGQPAATPVGPSGQETAPAPGGAVRTFDLTAAPASVELQPGVVVSVWAFNGTVPGPLLRVRQGDLVVVRLHNRLHTGTSIHWHGLAVPNGQDGTAGVTQDPVPPGGSATYSFVARSAGTYWYHSHQDGATQVDRGLYGVIVVDPPGQATAVDRLLVLDEWPLGLEMHPVWPASDPSMSAYVTVSMNGRSGVAIQPMALSAGRKARVRILNAGYLVHFVRFGGIPVTVVAFDGHELRGGKPTTDVLPVGPGERVDVELTAPPAPFWVDLQEGFPPSADAAMEVLPQGALAAAEPRPAAPEVRPVLDIFEYGARASDSPWPAGAAATRTFSLTLSESGHAAMAGMGMSGAGYEINGKAFPATQTLEVAAGDRVTITFVNRGRLDHTMHLHGEAFQVLAHDGSPAAGVIVKDTVVVRPGMSVTVGFVASNPGWWMVHCHELWHSAGGMMTLLHYAGAPRLAELGGRFGAVPD